MGKGSCLSLPIASPLWRLPSVATALRPRREPHSRRSESPLRCAPLRSLRLGMGVTRVGLKDEREGAPFDWGVRGEVDRGGVGSGGRGWGFCKGNESRMNRGVKVR